MLLPLLHKRPLLPSRSNLRDTRKLFWGILYADMLVGHTFARLVELAPLHQDPELLLIMHHLLMAGDIRMALWLVRTRVG